MWLLDKHLHYKFEFVLDDSRRHIDSMSSIDSNLFKDFKSACTKIQDLHPLKLQVDSLFSDKEQGPSTQDLEDVILPFPQDLEHADQLDHDS